MFAVCLHLWMFASKHVQHVPVSSTTLETFLHLGAPFFPTSVMDFGNLMDTILNLRGKNTATVKVGLWCKSPESIGPECREVWTILWVQYLHTSHFRHVVSSQGARRSRFLLTHWISMQDMELVCTFAPGRQGAISCYQGRKGWTGGVALKESLPG